MLFEPTTLLAERLQVALKVKYTRRNGKPATSRNHLDRAQQTLDIGDTLTGFEPFKQLQCILPSANQT